MEVESNPFTQVDREYRITSRELRKALKIKGRITSMDLYSGLSPQEQEDGESPEEEVWSIFTTEKTEDVSSVENKVIE